MPLYSNESSPYAQAQHAEDQYLAGAYSSSYSVSSAYQSGAYQDLRARYASAYAIPTVKTNAQLQSLTAPYAGGYMVTVATSAATWDTASTGSEDLEMETRVGNALKAGAYGIFAVGGPVGNFTASNYQSPYLDGLWLAEASKQTGTKFF